MNSDQWKPRDLIANVNLNSVFMIPIDWENRGEE